MPSISHIDGGGHVHRGVYGSVSCEARQRFNVEQRVLEAPCG